MLFQFYPCFNFIIDNFYTRNIFPWNLQLLERVTAFLNRKIALNNDINYLSKTRSKTSNANDEQMIDQIFLQRTETSNGLDNNNNNNNNNNIIYIYIKPSIFTVCLMIMNMIKCCYVFVRKVF